MKHICNNEGKTVNLQHFLIYTELKLKNQTDKQNNEILKCKNK